MSAFYNKPWAPGYALPGYVEKEDPLTRGSAVTTRWLPRGTISSVPPGSNHGGYAVPKYVLDEPVGSQAHTTPWLPRGTVMSMKSIKTGLPWKSNTHTLDSNGLGSLGATEKSEATVGAADPIQNYGKRAAQIIAQDFQAIPPAQREGELRKLLGHIDPKLYSEYKKQKAHLERLNVPPAEAEAKGLAIAFSQGITKEFMKFGEKAKKSKARAAAQAARDADRRRTPLLPSQASTTAVLATGLKPGLKKGQVALGMLMGFEAQADNYYGSLGGFTSTISNTLKKLGGAACDVATNPLTPLAAGAIGAGTSGAAGAATATTGVGIAAAACSQGTAGGGGFVAPQREGMPSWVIPTIIGGGALALILVLKD